MMFDGFEDLELPTDGARIRLRRGGNGPPLLLLHGYPQTGAMWHKVAERLRDRFTLLVPDLRGYGRSSKPASAPDHAPYSKRAMAADMVQVMGVLGHETFLIAAHDRGARVAHRLMLDHPARAPGAVLLDIAPTREMYAGTTDAFARAYWHWFFLCLPEPFPERMIAGDPEFYWRKKCGSGSAGLSPFTPEALAEYLAAWTPETIHASCEDYRAAAGIDLRHDDEDGGRKVEAPLRILWGEYGVIGRCFDPLGEWRKRAADVSGRALPGCHYLAEELPDLVADEIAAFFAGARPG
ncbi:alpha/beta fold hydrolase [Azospirillum picis]|uniref:Haloacetate dehalogenase n=1 Tax=Azospirillum picis TaxID=488438 RepID=A0ABU0MMW6_9PROT|nr:alpha/beta hydrolase [Azospirillum picis]MBP2300710.1 haloacetate dehalogenase [Azospirillum picis]MDQ0534679.1 haloacetate dehalogenase [Azospirillum picis]